VSGEIEHALKLLFPSGEEMGWKAQPKQALATELAGLADDLLYGGAAGGGKTEWLIEYIAGQMEAHAGNRGAIFRRVFPSLARTIVPRAKQKLYLRAKWNGQDHTFTFPNGSVMELASLQYAGASPTDPGDSVLAHQGTEYGVIGFEEITEFTQAQVEYLIGRLRAPADGIRPHLVATTNPGGRGHKWVKRWWVRPKADDLPEGQVMAPPYEPWRPRSSEANPKPRMRVFVPATIEDNPKLLERDPDYVNRLNAQSNRGLRLAMRQGDWDAIDQVEGALWSAEDLDMGRVRLAPPSARRVVSVDPSDGEDEGDAFGVSVASRGQDGVGYVEQSRAWRMSPRKMAEAAVNLYYEVGADSLIIERNHGGKWMLEVFRQVDPYVNVREVWASDGKRTRAEPVAALFEYDPRALWPFRSRIVGFQEELEAELTDTNFAAGEPSPNMLDAMVWAMTDLLLGNRAAKATAYGDERLTGRR
jgi:hypothetical protein